MDINGWDEVTIKKEGFDLNKIVLNDFLADLMNEFKGKKVSCINLSFIVMDEEIEPNKNHDINIVTIENRRLEDTLTETIHLSSNLKINELKEIIDKYNK